jgi:hypothetical protein
MDDQSIQEVVKEIAPLLIQRAPGKIFQLGPASFAIDFGLRERGYLFVSADPSALRLYLIQRRVRDLEKQSTPLNTFALTVSANPNRNDNGTAIAPSLAQAAFQVRLLAALPFTWILPSTAWS